jgi:hypothetical protein
VNLRPAVWIVLAVLLAQSAHAEPDLAALLVHEDDVVREAAECQWVRLAPHLEVPSTLPTEVATRLRRGTRVRTRLASAARDSVAFWRAVEDALDPALARVSPAILDGIDPSPTVVAKTLATRVRAQEVAMRFCLEWSIYVSPETEALEESLSEVGSAAVPHLLRVLGANPWQAFVGSPPEVSAKMQGAAVRAVGLLKAPEAVPYLVLHSMGPSYTIEEWAVGTLAGWTGSPGAPPEKPDEAARKIADEWWPAHRHEHAETTRWLAADLLRSVHRDVADDLAGKPRSEEIGTAKNTDVSAIRRLARLLGREMAYPVDASVAQRLQSIRAFEASYVD